VPENNSLTAKFLPERNILQRAGPFQEFKVSPMVAETYAWV